MKPISPALQTLLTTSDNFLFAELYTFTLASGAKDYFSSLDIPVTYGGNTYRANGLRIEGLKLKLAIGLQVDSQDIKIAAYPGETLAGTAFISAVGAGLLDNALISRSRAFWTPAAGSIASNFQAAPTGVVNLTNMLVSEITKIGRTHVELTVKSPTKLLDLDMPRNYYSPGCIHTLYDAGCTLNKATHGTNGTVGAAPTTLLIPWNGGVPSAMGADGLPSYAQGRLLFKSGALSGSQFSIGNNDNNNLALLYPLQQLPAVGDSFTAYLGCSKQMTTCNLKFANLLNFRGYPFVPPVYISL